MLAGVLPLPAANFSFDGNGNPTTYSNSTFSDATFTFDPENRLTGISSPSFSAAYDGDGLRAYSTAGGSTTYYLYDGGFPVAEENSSGDVTALNAMGPAGWTERDNVSGGYYDAYAYDPSGNLFARVESGETSYPAHDLSFYDGFGQLRGDVTVSDGDAQSPSDPVGFGGRWGYYTDTSTKLVLMTNRYYDPGVGRFVTRDPTGYAGGENLYGFAGNNPVNEQDPNGTSQDPGGLNDTFRLSFAGFIPTKDAGLGFIGDNRSFDPNTSKFRAQQNIIINEKTHAVTLLAPQGGATHWTGGVDSWTGFGVHDSNSEMGGSGKYLGNGLYSVHLWGKVANAVTYNASLRIAALHYDVHLLVDPSIDYVGGFGETTPFPAFELWSYTNHTAPKLEFGYKPVGYTAFNGLGGWRELFQFGSYGSIGIEPYGNLGPDSSRYFR